MCKRILILIIAVFTALVVSACSGSGVSASYVTDTPAGSASVSSGSPSPSPVVKVTLPDGRSLYSDVNNLRFEGLKHKDIDKLSDCFKLMPYLNYVDLGSEEGEDSLTVEDVSFLISEFPAVKFDYLFDVFGKPVSLDDEVLDFNHVPMDDNGKKIVSLMKILRNPKSLDMDFAGVDSSVLGDLRTEYPDTEINWRVWFGYRYSIRTDAERFVASVPDNEVLIGDALENLKYCTKLRFLDIGHNEIDDISFLSYLPELEAAILCINKWTDLSPVSDCKKLNYLEMNDTLCTDLTPIKGCTALEHLNVCNLKIASGWDAVASLKSLKRLWIGERTKISSEDLEMLRTELPDTVINIESPNSVLGEWKWIHYPTRVERYEQLFHEMGYNIFPNNQSYYYLDPKYYPEGYSGAFGYIPEGLKKND